MEPWHYIALLGAVVAVGALSMPRNKPSGPPVQSVQNMETALEQFMENMEKDNDDLMQMVAKSQAAAQEEDVRKDERIAALEKRCEALDLQLRETLDSLARNAVTPVGLSAPAASETAVSPASPAENDSSPSGTTASTTAIDRYENEPEASEPRPQSIVSRYSELFRLYEEGKSIEAIAKKLGMNKGEVQLIIGLAKQEGAAHV